MCESVTWSMCRVLQNMFSAHFVFSAVTSCRRGQISSRLVHHLCFACLCNSPRLVQISVCRLRTGITLLLVVPQNKCCAIWLCNPHAQIYFRISSGISFIVSRSFAFIIRGRLVGDNGFLFSLLPGLLFSILWRHVVLALLRLETWEEPYLVDRNLQVCVHNPMRGHL